MNIKRVTTLLGKELLHGSRGFILVMTIVAPLLITLVINLAVGNFFSNKAQLAVFDAGQSQLVGLLEEAPQLNVKPVSSPEALEGLVSSGAADSGIVIPAGFDGNITAGTRMAITVYVWGESPASNRTIITSTLLDSVHQLSGQPAPVTLETITLGDATTVPWSQRLLPLTVMAAIFLGGLMLPATSIIMEKQKATLQALSVTPASPGEIFTAKGVVGVLLSLIMGIIIILINRAWGGSPLLLLAVLALGSIMAAELGLILGTLINDMNTLFAIWKFGGLLLFGPAIIYVFPSLPQWLNYLFPTYYIVGPIMDISLGTVDTVTLLLIAVAAVILLVLGLVQSRLIHRLSGQELPHASARKA